MISKTASINRYNGLTHLGQGTFGDVWKAHDTKNKIDVAVKIFFKKGQYLTKKYAEALGIERKLVEAQEECQIVIDIMKQKDKDPVGASRICQCLEQHISDGGNTDPLFLVMELCGAPVDEIFESGTYQSEKPPVWARNTIKEVLQGLNYLAKIDPPRVHHDMKLENIVVNEAGHVKIIDWGSVMEFKTGRRGGVCTPQYTPPEVLCGVGPSYAYPDDDNTTYSGSFDMYSTGVMYWELVCNDRPYWDDDAASPGGYKIFDQVPSDRKCLDDDGTLASKKDFAILEKLMKENPKERINAEDALRMFRDFKKNRKSRAVYKGHFDSFMARTDATDCVYIVDEAECKGTCAWKDDLCSPKAGGERGVVVKRPPRARKDAGGVKEATNQGSQRARNALGRLGGVMMPGAKPGMKPGSSPSFKLNPLKQNSPSLKLKKSAGSRKSFAVPSMKGSKKRNSSKKNKRKRS